MKNINQEKIKKSILNGVEEVLNKVEDKYEAMSEKTTEFVSGAKEKAAEAKEQTENYIRKNPKKSVMIAAGVGAISALIVSFLMRRRKTNRY